MVATRGWCCLAEGPGADRLAPLCHCPQPQPPALRKIRSLRWAQHLPHASGGSAGNPMCITDPAQDNFIATGLLAHVSPRLCTGTSVVQMHLTGVGKGSDSPEKAAVSQEAPASHSPGEAEFLAWIQYQASSPPAGTSAAADMAPVTLVSCSTQGRGPEHLFSSALHHCNPDPAQPHRIPTVTLCQGPSVNAATSSMGSACRILPPGMRMEVESACHD